MKMEILTNAVDECAGGATADDRKSPNDRFVRSSNRRSRHRLSRAADESGRPARRFTLYLTLSIKAGDTWRRKAVRNG